VLNLAAKLCLTNPKQTKVLTQYVLNLAKYDMNYDLRDRQAAFFITLIYEIKYMLYRYKLNIFPLPFLQMQSPNTEKAQFSP
jgi:hypothetical protein